VNGARARKGTIVRAGDTVTVLGPESTSPLAPASLSLAILHEDDDVVAIDKPPGIPTTVGRTPGPTIAAALLARYPEMAALGDARHAGLLHRLDTGTSGLLLAARRPGAYTELRAAFARKAARKDYLAIVAGRLAAPRIVTVALARHRRSRNRMVLARPGARAWPARTEITPVGGDETLTVVRLRMRTGVTHQLRVHCASIGHPIVGDRRYGTRDADHALGTLLSSWHYLHAHALAFDDPKLATRIATPFPEHWRPLFATRNWSTAIADAAGE
jgi:23S rRNA pseudouridine1911/1915/1917 synthase